MKKVRDSISLLFHLIDGKKTYVGFVITFLAGGLYFTNKISKEMAEMVAALGGLIAAVGLRHAIQKVIDGLE